MKTLSIKAFKFVQEILILRFKLQHIDKLLLFLCSSLKLKYNWITSLKHLKCFTLVLSQNFEENLQFQDLNFNKIVSSI